MTATLAWFLAAARTMAGPPMSICSTHSSGADKPAHRLHEQRALGGLDSLMQGGLVIVIVDGNGCLRDDRAAVGTGIDQEDGAAGNLRAVLQRVPDPVHAGKRR